MITLSQARNSIGRRVVYETEYSKPKEGVIRKVNKEYVFVAFVTDDVISSTPCACFCFQLSFSLEWQDAKRWEGLLDD